MNTLEQDPVQLILACKRFYNAFETNKQSEYESISRELSQYLNDLRTDLDSAINDYKLQTFDGEVSIGWLDFADRGGERNITIIHIQDQGNVLTFCIDLRSDKYFRFGAEKLATIDSLWSAVERAEAEKVSRHSEQSYLSSLLALVEAPNAEMITFEEIFGSDADNNINLLFSDPELINSDSWNDLIENLEQILTDKTLLAQLHLTLIGGAVSRAENFNGPNQRLLDKYLNSGLRSMEINEIIDLIQNRHNYTALSYHCD